jgi:hypothetical protein
VDNSVDDTPERGAQNLGAVLDLAQDFFILLNHFLFVENLLSTLAKPFLLKQKHYQAKIIELV